MPLGGLVGYHRQPYYPPNHSKQIKRASQHRGSLKKIFLKTKRQYFDYAKRSIFDFNGIGGQFTIEAVQVDSRAKYAMKINEIKQACIHLSGRKGDKMEKFKKYAEILKDFSKDMELWKTCEEDDIADAERKYNQNALPEQIKKIRSEYAKKYVLVRENALTKVRNETKSIKQRNQGKFKPDFVDLELLKELNAINMAGIPMTESEITAYCRRALASRSSFCVRAVQNIAKKSNIRLNVPTEDTAVQVIDAADKRLRKIISIYDGEFKFGDKNKDQSLIMDSHGWGDSGFLGRLEKEYQSATLEDIKISQMSRKEFETKSAVARVEQMKKPVESVEIGEDIGIRAKDDGSKSVAAQYAKKYSQKMLQAIPESNPEFE